MYVCMYVCMYCKNAIWCRHSIVAKTRRSKHQPGQLIHLQTFIHIYIREKQNMMNFKKIFNLRVCLSKWPHRWSLPYPWRTRRSKQPTRNLTRWRNLFKNQQEYAMHSNITYNHYSQLSIPTTIHGENSPERRHWLQSWNKPIHNCRIIYVVTL